MRPARRPGAASVGVTPDPPVKVLYIAGVSHCGSTILGTVLGQIEGFFFAGELAHTSLLLGRDGPCSCGAPLATCPVWREIFHAAFGERTDGLKPGLLGLSHADERAVAVLRHMLRERGLYPSSREVERARAAFLETLRAIRSTTSSRVIVDSSKSPAYGWLLQSTQAVDLHVLHLVRDPRATAWSWRESPDQPWGPTTLALIWNVWNSTIELLWGRSRARYFRLRYEDFARRPDASVRRILDFVGESQAQSPVTTDSTVDVRETHSVAGNRNRFRTGPVQVALDERWLSGDGLPGRRRLDALTRPLRARYHYAGRERSG
ncbi:MAG: sulfotransferase [Actinomycetota bacterium]|nr:sulfotransferase [Actinomycetota bacterium]